MANDVASWSGDEGTVGAEDAVSRRIIGCAFAVANTLGYGFLEKVYENALALELRTQGLTVQQQHAMTVLYRGDPVGHYVADLVVEGIVIVEVKAVKSIDPMHLAQCRNYLKASGLRLCLLLGFGGPRVEIKRVVLNL